MKKNKKQIILILIILTLLISCILFIVHKGYSIHNSSNFYSEFIGSEIKLLIDCLNKDINNSFDIENSDQIVFVVKQSLVDSCDYMILYDFKKKKIAKCHWKFNYNDSRQKEIDIWGIENKINSFGYLYFYFGKFIKQLNVIQDFVDGQAVFVYYKNKVKVFNNPGLGLSPYDQYVNITLLFW
jgi:hypothetical protein